jgi:lysophospholipase L1-like esterase
MSMMTVDKGTFRLIPVTNIGREVLSNDYEYYVADDGEFGHIDESGNIKTDINIWTTGFIPVKEGKKYILQCHYDGVNKLPFAVYDSNMTFIKRDLLATNDLTVYIPSAGVSFIRMSMMTVDKGTFRLIPVTNIGNDGNIAGLKINFLGDSITQGVGTTKTYHQFLQEKFGVVSRNYGISGSTISDRSTPMFSRALTMDEDADYVFVFGGTNDFFSGVQLGKLYTLSGSTKIATNDTSTFYGALHTLCVNLINRFPDKKIVLMTPIHREHFGGQPTEFETNAIGLYLIDYVNAIKEVGEWYSIPVLDLYATSGLNPNIPIHKEKFFSPTDGLHPKAEGHEVIANRIKAFLNTI